MYKIGSLPHSIPIGYTGETNFRTIEIDMTAWIEKMPAGVPSIVHIRPGESKEDAYVAVTEFNTETNVLTWNITAADIGTLEGEGTAQIWLEEPDEEDTDVISKRGKSVQIITKVMEAANDPSSTVPSSQEAFLEQITSLKTQTVTAQEAAEAAQEDAEDAAQQAQQAATDAENVNLHPAYIDDTTKHWMVYDATQHQYVDTEIKAVGEDGQDGQNGQNGQDATPDLICLPYEDLTFPVSKGTLCYHGSDLCKAKQDISTSEAWTAAHWDVTNIDTELSLVKNHIQGVSDLLTEESEPSVNIFDGNFDESGYIDANGDDASGVNYKRTSKYYPIDTTKTKLYTFRQDGTVGTLDMCFYDSRKAYISKVGYKTAPKEITLPEGAAYFRSFCDAAYNGGITVSYTSVSSYIPYDPGGLKVKENIIGYDNLTEALQEKIDDIDDATAAAEAAEEAVGELIVNKATANLFDSDFDESGYIDDENGDKASSSYVRTSKYYPVDESKGTIYSYNPDNGNTTNLLFYNAQKVFISRVNIAAELTSKSIPEGAAYFRLYRNYYKTQPITITYDYAGHTIPYKHWSEVKENMVGYDSVNLEGKRMLGSVLAGRKILVFGDSIIGNDRVEGVCDFLAEYSGATVYNGAIGGTRITDLRSSQYDSPNYVYFDGVKLVHALMTNTWTDQDAHISDVSTYVGEETLPMLKALDVSTLDMIVLAYGRNDITTSETLQNIKDAIDTIIADIQSHYPTVRILVLTPIWGMFSSGTVDGDSYESTSGMTLRTMTDGMLSEAKAKHVSSCDMLENMQLSQNTMETYMDNDHVHLNSAGNAMYAHILNGKLRSMF